MGLPAPGVHVKRRAWLALCAGALASGCLGVTGPPRKTIAWLRLENERSEARDVEVVVDRGDEEVFREHYRLGTGSASATVRVSDPVDEPGRYSMHVDLGEQVVHLSPTEVAEAVGSDPCVGVQFTIHEEETSGFEVEPVPEC